MPANGRQQIRLKHDSYLLFSDSILFKLVISRPYFALLYGNTTLSTKVIKLIASLEDIAKQRSLHHLQT